MAKKIKWSPLAEKKFDEILEYWTNRNKSESFSEKLIDLFEEATELIANFPEMGRSTDIGNVRQELVRDYLMFYELDGEIINILTI
ncbi:type II toxin-antitoxin system RelE/ParE family toxin [Cyclobacterium salsum]|uniref:type II toxin-antitoxin system RelE/ParE family toxin n=1 Tax=Cyclobacterium salsum TaxID=2666329 RepID=UPI001390DFE9|nr:type II toxin-antitoxin system RelE/ParE family toxin [Cyclobacterium salsum]